MPLLPIDLQTLFAQMNQVGRQQAVQQDVSPQYQFVQADEIRRRTEHDDSAVNETHQVSEGVEKVKEEKEREKRRSASQKRREQRSGGKEEKKIFEDPDLGHHINIKS